jgi:hypothetical protein
MRAFDEPDYAPTTRGVHLFAGGGDEGGSLPERNGTP